MAEEISNAPGSPDEERLLALLGDRATTGLSVEAEQELGVLMGRVADAEAIARSFDRVEGGLVALEHGPGEALPAGLRARLAGEGRALVAAQGGVAEAPIPFWRAGPGQSAGDGRSGAFLARLGWLVAAAAVLQAAAAWWPSGGGVPEVVSPADRRSALAREDESAVHVDLDPATEAVAQGVVADIIWSDARQEGYLRVRGLAINDASLQQYQLWIYDAARDDRYPVDGGVFDVALASIDPLTRELVIPIRASLRVGRAQMFAITLEPAGGVVVPGERLLLRGVARLGLG